MAIFQKPGGASCHREDRDVILADARGLPCAPRIGGRATLDDLFKWAAGRRPDAMALLDAPDRARDSDGAPRALTYRQADRMVSAIAGRLRRMGLHTDAIVAMQMASTVENVLTILGVLRAGLIAMPLPVLWRRTDMVTALNRIGPMALIVGGRISPVDHYQFAMQVAAEVFPIRHVCGYGRNVPDGLVCFDDLFTADEIDPLPAWGEGRAAQPGPGAHLAAITWDISADGLIPVARSHAELIAGAVAITLESRLRQDAKLLSALTLSSFAGIASTMVPWLLAGGTLALHHPFDLDAYLAQFTTVGADCVLLPGSIAVELAELSRPRMGTLPTDVIAVWRAPDQLTQALPWRNAGAGMTDILAFGETGLVAARRGRSGKPAVIPFGTVPAPRAAGSNIIVAEIRPTAMGTVAMRGPMVPQAPFPPGAERGRFPHMRISANGYVDTGYSCRPGTTAMVVIAPPAGMVTAGGNRPAFEQPVTSVDGPLTAIA
jgi:hypothetical protein